MTDTWAEIFEGGPPKVAMPRSIKAAKRGNPERDAQVSVVAYIRRVVPACCVFAVINESHADSGDGIGRARFYASKIKAGLCPGFPDLGVLLPEGRVLLIEMKRPDGGALSPSQRGLHPQLSGLGHPVAVCRSIDDARAALARMGVVTRERP